MKLLFDFLPVLLFFAVYKLYAALPPELLAVLNQVPLMDLRAGEAQDAIFLATAVAMLASALHVGLVWLLRRRVQALQLVALGLILVFGATTLLLHDPVFIQWKPSLLNWLFAAVFLASHWIGERNLAERLMGEALSVSTPVWRRVNLAWAAFFAFAGAANLAVAYTASEAAWVNFKLFGLFGLTIAFTVGQALYLARFMEAHSPEAEPAREET